MSLSIIYMFADVANERLSVLKDDILLAFKNQEERFNNLLHAIGLEIFINLVRDLKT